MAVLMYARMEYGAQFASLAGAIMKLLLFVDILDTTLMVQPISPILVYILTFSPPDSKSTNVFCAGSPMLSDLFQM